MVERNATVYYRCDDPEKNIIGRYKTITRMVRGVGTWCPYILWRGQEWSVNWENNRWEVFFLGVFKGVADGCSVYC